MVIAAVVAVVAVAAIVAGVLLVSASDPESTAEPEPASARSDDASSASDSSTDASSDPSSEAGSTEPTSTVRPVTPTAADPRHPLGLDGHWVAMLVAYNRETDAHSHLASFPPGSSVLHSNDYTSLNPDYYVIFYNGGFATGEQAAAWCRSEGYTSDAGCYGRFLSLEPGVDPEAPELKVSP